VKKINAITLYLDNGEFVGNFAFGRDNPHSFLLQCGVYDRKRDLYVIDNGFTVTGIGFKLTVLPGYLVKVKE